MLRINPKSLANLGLGNSLISSDGETTQSGEVFTKLATKKCMKDGDANKDGVITRDEVTLSDAAYAKLDADSNGKVTEEEMGDALAGRGNEVAAYYAKYRKAAKSMTLLANILGDSSSGSGNYAEAAAKKYIAGKDANKNGLLEKGEVSLSAETFSAIDTDKSGSISLSEMKASLKGQESRLAAYFKSQGTSADATDLTSSLLKKI